MRRNGGMRCPKCRQAMSTGMDGGVAVWVCLTCQQTACKQPKRETQDKLPGLDPGVQTVYIKQAEKALCRRIKRDLERNGYRVFLVGQMFANLGGNDEGCPDMFVSPIGENDYKGLEVKLPGYSPSDVRPVQQVLYDNGETDIVTSTEEALAVLRS